MKYDSTIVVDPVDLTAVKAYLSLNLTVSSEDALLTSLVTQSRGILDEWLPFWTAMSTIYCIANATSDTIVLKGPVSEVLEVCVFVDGEWVDITEDCTQYLDSVTIPGDVHGRVKFVYSTDGFCPAPVQTAILMMVRTLYLDRNADPMTDAVMRIITPYLEVNV